MATAQTFENFTQKVADGMVRLNNEATSGLPHYLGVVFDEMGPGFLRAHLDVKEELLTPFGTMHGGVMAGFVDHVMGCVLYPLMKKGQWAATTEFKLNYLAPVKGGTLLAESKVVLHGRRTAVVTVEVEKRRSARLHRAGDALGLRSTDLISRNSRSSWFPL